MGSESKYLTAKPKNSRQKQRAHGKTKYFTAKTKYLTAKANTHGKTKAILFLLWSIWFSREVCCFCREVFGFAVRYFVFAVRFLFLPWGILFLPWGFWFCGDSCGPPYKTLSLSLVFILQFQTKHLASLTNQNARFYSIMRFYSKLITVPKYLSAGNCRTFQKSPRLKGNPRQSGLVDSRYSRGIPDYVSVELGIRISIVNGIPVSFNCIPDSKQKIPGFRIRHEQNFPDFGVQILLHGTTRILNFAE